MSRRAVLILSMAAAATLLGCRPKASPPPPLPQREARATAEDGTRLWYRVLGAGEETVIVPNALFHADRLDALASPTRRLVLYDPRGRGRSEMVPTSRVSLDLNISDVETIRRAVGAERVALIGWSGMGMELVVYALRHPQRVSRIIQLAPVAPRYTPYGDSLMASRRSRTDGRALADLQARAAEYRDRPEEYCRALARVTNPASFGDTTFATQAPDVCIWPTEWPDHIGPYFNALLGSMGSWDWRPRLRTLAMPRLVIHGARDNTPLVGNCEWVVGQEKARIVVIDGAGHWPHFERHTETIAAMRTFLDGQWPAVSWLVSSPGDTPCR